MHRLLTAIVLLPVLASTPSGLSAQPAALLIRGGQLVDGTGTPPRAADVRISGDTIVEVGEHLAPRAGERVIDAAGRVVSPGFIDMHSHAAGGLDDHPDAASQIRQGITTALMGQDGSGELPVSDFFEHMEKVHPAINVLTSVGHGTVRGLVMGGDYKRAATPPEIDAMKVIVERGMKDGAVGLSSGIEYDPGFYATTDELAALAAVIKPYGGFYSSHVRDEENDVLAAWSEAIEIGRRAGVPVEISHMKLASAPVWGQAAKGLALVDAARRAGQDVTGDWYPYPYWHSSIYVLIPDRDFDNLVKWQRGLDEVGGPANVLISSYKPDPSWVGRTVADLAAERHIDAPRHRDGHGRKRHDGDLRAPRDVGLLGWRAGRPASARLRRLPPRARPLRPRAARRVDAGRDREDVVALGPQARADRSRHDRAGAEGGPGRLRSRDDRRSRHAGQSRAVTGRDRLRDCQRRDRPRSRHDHLRPAGPRAEAHFNTNHCAFGHFPLATF